MAWSRDSDIDVIDELADGAIMELKSREETWGFFVRELGSHPVPARVLAAAVVYAQTEGDSFDRMVADAVDATIKKIASGTS